MWCRIGPGLAFIAYPEGLAMMPLAPFWSVLFFVMLFTLGVDSQFGMLETGVTALVDEFPALRRGRRKVVVVAVVCLVLFLLGLPQCSRVSRPAFPFFTRGLEQTAKPSEKLQDTTRYDTMSYINVRSKTDRKPA